MLILSKKIIKLIEDARSTVAKTANSAMVYTYFSIGKLIVEEFQSGNIRAEYGQGLLKELSHELSQKFKRGYSVQNLERMRIFYLTYSNSPKELRNSDIFQKSSNVLRISVDTNQSVHLLPLSWSHYLFLMGIDNETERQFYEIESYKNQWTLKDLERQFDSGLFLRLIKDKTPEKALKLAKNGQEINTPQDIVKEPLVLEFLGLEEKSGYSETQLETAIINQIEKFMLELGKGFFFGGRQVRFSFNEDNFFVDLVFYNRFLKCFVLIDLKIGKLKHQDIGQMQMYMNYYDRFVKQDDENSTIGIILCRHKNNAIVEITLPQSNNLLFATKYQTVLPSKEELKQLIENGFVK